MNKSELVASAADQSGLSRRDTELALSAILDVITTALVEGERIQLMGFGTYEVKDRAARLGRNPKTKEPVQIPARKAVVFKAGKVLQEAVAN